MKAFLFPGQGSQKKGMGAELFSKYPEYVKKANKVLGYSIETLCISDPNNQLNHTLYTQPAIFVVSVLNYLNTVETISPPHFLAGHSIGEYAALFAANVFDFETGLQIVKKRAELMSNASGGGLAAVLDLPLAEVEARIDAFHLSDIEIANINSSKQVVIGGGLESIESFIRISKDKSGRIIPLRVSGAFHTSHMKKAQSLFNEYLKQFHFELPTIPVVSNYSAELHDVQLIVEQLAKHLTNKVRWVECIEYMLAAGVEDFVEVGSTILMPMVTDIRSHYFDKPIQSEANSIAQINTASGIRTSMFCRRFGFDKPMVVGGSGHKAMGVELVTSLALSQVLSFLDTSQLTLIEVEEALQQLNAVIAGQYGVNLTFDIEAHNEEGLIQLCLKYAVRFIEVRGYFTPTPALIKYRLEGGLDDQSCPNNRILLHVAEHEVAKNFLKQLSDVAIDPDIDNVNLINQIPIVDAVCVATKTWRSIRSIDTDLFDQVMDQCKQLKCQLPFGKIFIGLSGHSAKNNPVEAALKRGADFSLLSAVFLLADESSLDNAIKAQLSNADEHHFRETFDWSYPAFRSASFSCVLNEKLSEEAADLQKLYLSDALDVKTLTKVNVQYAENVNTIVDDDFIESCNGMNQFEIRSSVANRVRSKLFPNTLYCESSFSNVVQWLNESGVTYPIGAVPLANRIYSRNP